MSEKAYLLGIDIGTSSCKVAVFNRGGSVIDSAGSSYPVHYPHAGWAEQDPDDWWQGVCSALKKIWEKGLVKPSQIACIGIDGQSWAAIAVDAEGRSLCPTPIWMDVRSQDICDRLNRSVGEDRIFRVSGNGLRPSYTTAKVLWYGEHLPQVLEKTDKILQSNAYIALRLTGQISQDICQAYGWHCFNMRSGTWDTDLAKDMGIDSSCLPPIVPCDHIVGRVTKEAASLSSLAEGTPVIAGGLDAACASLGAGVLHNGDTQEQGGQAGGMSICLDTYSADPSLILSFHVVPGCWLLQGGTVGGGGVMRWFEQEFADYERSISPQKGLSSFDQLNLLAEKVSPGCDGLVFLPYMSGERSPIWNPNAKGVFFGLDFSKTKGHMARACMEGVAYSLRHNLEVAEAAGAHVEILRAVGGSANSLLWTQIKSDVTGKPIVVPYSDEATTLGAAILAGVGCGMYASYDEAVSLTVRETRRHEPDRALSDTYRLAYETYRQLYDHLAVMM